MVLSDLKTAEPFHPQEGHMRLPDEMTDMQARVTTSPVTGGTAMAVRLLPRVNIFRPLSELGFSPAAFEAVNEILHNREGIMLVTGPTGSGKSTTIYSMLQILNTQERNLVSIEDPVEFVTPFIRQMAVDTTHGLTMNSGLRTLLRMDPDVVFVGEIRDAEAADIAMRAASSGKYVFSTLHTRDVASTVTALRDLHIDSRSLAGNLAGIISQRLIRRLCKSCGKRESPTDDERRAFEAVGMDVPARICRAKGCAECRGTGYQGRVGVFEVVASGEAVNSAIARGAAEDELRQTIRAAGTPGLEADALMKAAEGTTSVEEAQSMSWI
jgi:type IV pilus assembly protein PilB